MRITRLVGALALRNANPGDRCSPGPAQTDGGGWTLVGRGTAEGDPASAVPVNTASGYGTPLADPFVVGAPWRLDEVVINTLTGGTALYEVYLGVGRLTQQIAPGVSADTGRLHVGASLINPLRL